MAYGRRAVLMGNQSQFVGKIAKVLCVLMDIVTFVIVSQNLVHSKLCHCFIPVSKTS